MDVHAQYNEALAKHSGEFVGMVLSSMNELAHGATNDTDATLVDLAEAPLVQMVEAPDASLPKVAADGVVKSMALASHAILAVAVMHLAHRGPAALHAFTRDLEAFCGLVRPKAPGSSEKPAP